MSKNTVSLLGIIAAIVLGFGIAVAGSQAGFVYLGWPLFALCVGSSFLIQWLGFFPAYVLKTEKFFDLFGSLTYSGLVLLVWFLLPEMSPRDYLIGGFVLIWAARLGQFLFRRVLAAGEDRRFRTMKTDFLQFLMTWSLQGLWVSITLSAGLAAMTALAKVPLGLWALLGSLFWILGFAIEVIADHQKSVFRSDPAHRDRFITSGLWAWSRHPNYFGEILLWFGIAIIAFPVLKGWQLVTLISPVFVFVLMNYISGVRMLEARADRKWGQEEDYQAYKMSTPSLWLKPPKSK